MGWKRGLKTEGRVDWMRLAIVVMMFAKSKFSQTPRANWTSRPLLSNMLCMAVKSRLTNHRQTEVPRRVMNAVLLVFIDNQCWWSLMMNES